MKKVLLFLLLTSVGFSQQLRFTGSQIGLGNGRIFSGQFIQGLVADTVVFGDVCYLLNEKTSFYLADSDSLLHFGSILGVVVEDTVNTGEQARLLIKGILIDSSYSFTPDEKIYVGNNGAIIATPPLGTLDQINYEIGFAINDSTIYINTETGGYYWDDLRFSVSNTRLPGSKAAIPTLYQGTEVLALPTNQDATVYFQVQMPHTWVEGTDIEIHYHYALSANGAANDSIRTVFTYSWSNINGTIPAPTTINITNDVSSKIDSTHYLKDLGVVSATGKTISSVLLCSITRDVSEDNYSGSVYILYVDVHHLTDGKGSRQELVK